MFGKSKEEVDKAPKGQYPSGTLRAAPEGLNSWEVQFYEKIYTTGIYDTRSHYWRWVNYHPELFSTKAKAEKFIREIYREREEVRKHSKKTPVVITEEETTGYVVPGDEQV